MPNRDKGKKEVVQATQAPAVRVRVHGQSAIGPTDPFEPTAHSTESILAKSGGRLARWFKLRASLLSSTPIRFELDDYETDATADGDDHFDTTGASTSENPKDTSTKKHQVQRIRSNSRTNSANSPKQSTKRRPSTSPGSRAFGDQRVREAIMNGSDTDQQAMPSALEKHADSAKEHLRQSKRNIEPQVVQLLEASRDNMAREQSEHIKKLREEMAGKLGQIRGIKNIQLRNKLEEQLASELVEKERQGERHLETLQKLLQQEIEQSRLKPLKERLQSELDERMRSKEAQSKTDLNDVGAKIRAENASQVKKLLQEIETKLRQHITSALVEAKNKVRKEAEDANQRFEASVMAQVTDECLKIDDDCNARIEAINRERIQRRSMVRDRGQEKVVKERNRPERLQEVAEKEKILSSTIEEEAKKSLQLEKESLTIEFTNREALATAALEQDAVHKLESTKNLFQEHNRKKLHECSREIEREVEAKMKSARSIKTEERRIFEKDSRIAHEKEIAEKSEMASAVKGQEADTRAEESELTATYERQFQTGKAKIESATRQQLAELLAPARSGDIEPTTKRPSILKEGSRLDRVSMEWTQHQSAEPSKTPGRKSSNTLTPGRKCSNTPTPGRKASNTSKPELTTPHRKASSTPKPSEATTRPRKISNILKPKKVVFEEPKKLQHPDSDDEQEGTCAFIEKFITTMCVSQRPRSRSFVTGIPSHW